MADTVFGFIGFGLIGASIAKSIKKKMPQAQVLAFMRSKEKLKQAQTEGLADQITDCVGPAFSQCDIIFLCTPVEYNAFYLEAVNPYLKEGALITDVGSTKTHIHQAAARLQMEDTFIGGHPMAGSEKTGWENATDHLLENAYYIITPTKKSKKQDIERMLAVAHLTDSIPIVLDYQEHDRIVAAISHLPHLIASSLVNLVKDSDNSDHLMKRLAAGGFKDITRIASASPEMWQQICMANTDNIVQMMEDYISSLQDILDSLRKKDQEAVHHLFADSRTYRNSISDTAPGPLTPDYSFTVDIVDEPGAIATLSCILSARGISMSNIGINHNREHGEGALRIRFYDEDSMNRAWEALAKYNYDLIKEE